MDKKILLGAFCGATLALVQSNLSSAQPIWLNLSTEEMPKAFMNAEDSNGDGIVAADEFKGPADNFRFFDKNGDGVIEFSEAPTPDNLPKGIAQEEAGPPNMSADGSGSSPVTTINLNGVDFNLYEQYDFFVWEELPLDVKFQRMGIKEFTSPIGIKHYYEVISISSGNLNWYQAAYLAQDAGGYLACPTSEEENRFLFNQVNNRKYFWFFPPYDGSQRGNHYEIGIGPFLGGYQPEGSDEPAGGWSWLSGEKWDYDNWAVNLDDGVTDKDPRNNTQPNDSGNNNQRVMGFGEMNQPVPTWGDYMDGVGTYGVKRSPGKSYGFIIEYESDPRN